MTDSKTDPSQLSNLRHHINGVRIEDLCKWVPDDERIADFNGENSRLRYVAPHLLQTSRVDTFLWLALLMCHPRWRRGAQGIGDCVSWGAELVATVLMALQACKGDSRWITEAATEPIYGGGRVEAQGKKQGGYQDGSFGAAAAKWLRDWGVILRLNYGDETGNLEHDLRKYSKDKAKEWGNWGCGGQNDNDILDGVARQFPIQHVVAVQDVDEAAAAICNLYPITIASMAGFGDMRRDSRGVVRRTGQWPHQMCVLGVRFRAGEPEFRIFQSWGDSCSGPDPGIDHAVISACSWWATAEDMAWILRSGDCWIMGDIGGLPAQSLEVVQPLSRWYQPSRSEPQYTLTP